MRVRIQHVEEKKQEEALLRLTGEDVCSAGLKEYIETDSWRMVSLSCRKGGEIHRVKSSEIFYVESVQEVQLIHAEGDVLETRERLYVLEKCFRPLFEDIPFRYFEPGPGEEISSSDKRPYGSEAGKRRTGIYIQKYLREVRDRILDSMNEGGVLDDKEKHQE